MKRNQSYVGSNDFIQWFKTWLIKVESWSHHLIFTGLAATWYPGDFRKTGCLAELLKVIPRFLWILGCCWTRAPGLQPWRTLPWLHLSSWLKQVWASAPRLPLASISDVFLGLGLWKVFPQLTHSNVHMNIWVLMQWVLDPLHSIFDAC